MLMTASYASTGCPWDNRAGQGIQMVFSSCAARFRLDELKSRTCPFGFSTGDWEQLKHIEQGRKCMETVTGCTAKSMSWGALATWWYI